MMVALWVDSLCWVRFEQSQSFGYAAAVHLIDQTRSLAILLTAAAEAEAEFGVVGLLVERKEAAVH